MCHKPPGGDDRRILRLPFLSTGTGKAPTDIINLAACAAAILSRLSRRKPTY